MSRKYDQRRNRLTDTKLRKAKGPPWKLHDGGGLVFIIDRRGNHSIAACYNFMIDGKPHSMGLGGYPDLSLKKAREKADKFRAMRAEGVNPLTEKRSHRLAASLAAAKTSTFARAAEDHVLAHEAQWKDPRHAASWRSGFHLHCKAIANLPVAAIDTAILVDKVLRPLWHKAPSSAKKLRAHIEAVLDSARVKGLRPDTPNPARWRGHLDKLLVAPAKLRPIQHYEAVPLAELPGVIAKLREHDGIAARALELLTLTGVRSEQLRRAKWTEIDLAAATWTCPPQNVKGAKTSTAPHRVALSSRAVAILSRLPRTGETIFPMAINAMATILRALHTTATVHGMRSCLADWARAQGFAEELWQLALNHSVGDAVRRAYARDDLLPQRAALMEAWAEFLTRPPRKPGDVVVPLRGGARG